MTLLHILELRPIGQKKELIYLREKEDHLFHWFYGKEEKETGVIEDSVEKAIAKAYQAFKRDLVHSLHFGFVYDLLCRDEHGMNALFYQFKEAYETKDGIYYDKRLGDLKQVRFYSIQAVSLFKKLKEEKRL